MLNPKQIQQLSRLLETVHEITANSISAWHQTLKEEVDTAITQIEQLTVATSQTSLIQQMVKTFDKKQQAIIRMLEFPLKALQKLTESGHIIDSDKAQLLTQLGRTYDMLTQWDAAVDGFYRALDYCQDDLPQKAAVLQSIGKTKSKQRNYTEANKRYRDSLAIYSELQDHYQIAQIHIHLGWNDFRCHNYSSAEANYQKAKEIAESTAGAERLVADVDMNMAILATVRGDFEAALSHYEQSVHGYTSIDEDRGLSQAYYNMAMLYTDTKAWQKAGESYQKSLEYAQSVGDLHLIGHIYLSYTELALKLSNLDLAQACCMHAVKTFGRLGSQSPLGESYKFAGLVNHRKGNWDKANLFFQRSIQAAKECRAHLNLAEAHYEYGLALSEKQDLEQAKVQLNQALDLFTTLEAKADIQKTQIALARTDEPEAKTDSGRAFKRIKRP